MRFYGACKRGLGRQILTIEDEQATSLVKGQPAHLFFHRQSDSRTLPSTILGVTGEKSLTLVTSLV